MTFQKISTAVSLALMVAGLASANSITISCSTAMGPTDLNGQTSGSVSCPGDSLPASDTITNIVVTLTGSIGPASIDLTNNNSQSETGSAMTSSPFLLETILPGTSFSSTLFTVSAQTPTITLAGKATSGNIAVTGTGSATQSVSSGNFAFYENPFSFTGQTNDTLSASFGGGNVTASQVTNASLTATVQYTFTPAVPGAPEPASMALMGSALIGLGFLRKRTRG